MVNSGDVAVAPVWFDFMELAGATKFTDGTNPAYVEYKGVPGCTTASADFIDWNECGDGEKSSMAGAVADFELSWDSAGTILRPKFTLSGKYAGKSTVPIADKTKPTGYDTGDCESFLGAIVEMGGQVYNSWSGTLSLQNDNQGVEDSSDVTNGVKTGYKYFAVKGCDIQLTMQVEKIPLGTYDVEGNVVANKVFDNLTITLNGFVITLNTAQPIDIQNANKNESGAFDLTIKIDGYKIEQK